MFEIRENDTLRSAKVGDYVIVAFDGYSHYGPPTPFDAPRPRFRVLRLDRETNSSFFVESSSAGFDRISKSDGKLIGASRGWRSYTRLATQEEIETVGEQNRRHREAMAAVRLVSDKINDCDRKCSVSFEALMKIREIIENDIADPKQEACNKA